MEILWYLLITGIDDRFDETVEKQHSTPKGWSFDPSNRENETYLFIY